LSPEGTVPIAVLKAIARSVVDACYAVTYAEVQEEHRAFEQKYHKGVYADAFLDTRLEIYAGTSMNAEQEKHEGAMILVLCDDVVVKWAAWEKRCANNDCEELGRFEEFVRAGTPDEARDWGSLFSEWRTTLPLPMQRSHLVGLFERAMQWASVIAHEGVPSAKDILRETEHRLTQRTQASFPLCFVDEECFAARSRYIANVTVLQAVHGLTYRNLYDVIYMFGLHTGTKEMPPDVIIGSLRECTVKEEGRTEDHTMLSYSLSYMFSAETAAKKFNDVGALLYSLAMYLHSVARYVRSHMW